jgi:hypothetical protein
MNGKGGGMDKKIEITFIKQDIKENLKKQKRLDKDLLDLGKIRTPIDPLFLKRIITLKEQESQALYKMECELKKGLVKLESIV